MRVLKIYPTLTEFYEIYEGEKLWTARKTANGWLITAEGSRKVKPDGKRGKRLLKAIEKANANYRDRARLLRDTGRRQVVDGEQDS
jgi:hypothetical protein